jgi:NAD(P)-dependent dehydrogenase (short-subunit alcohol dehydrogenase family)
MSRRILVTGATGETGRYTTDLLISQGFEIRALAHKVDERSEKLRARGAEVIVGERAYQATAKDHVTSRTRALELKNMRSLLYRRVPTRTGVSEGLRAPIRPLMETIAVLRQASFQPTSSVVERSAFGDDFFFGFCLLA